MVTKNGIEHIYHKYMYIPPKYHLFISGLDILTIPWNDICYFTETFVLNMIKESRAVVPEWDFSPITVLVRQPSTFNLLLVRIFQILDKVSNVIQVVLNRDIKGAFRFPAWDFGNCTCSMERHIPVDPSHSAFCYWLRSRPKIAL